jgi:hypothetical protein
VWTSLPSRQTFHWHTLISWPPFNKGPITKCSILRFCVWKSWLLCLVMGVNDNPNKILLYYLTCVMFGHGCQLTFFSAHNWRVEGASWREWSFRCLVIECFWTILKNSLKEEAKQMFDPRNFFLTNSRMAMLGYKVVLIQFWRKFKGKGQGTMWL